MTAADGGWIAAAAPAGAGGNGGLPPSAPRAATPPGRSRHEEAPGAVAPGAA
jgi:hypothetical protein